MTSTLARRDDPLQPGRRAMIHGRHPANPGRGALGIALIYAAFASAWILFSDMALEALFTDPLQITRASIFKGWAFVAITSLLLYRLAHRYGQRIAASQLQRQSTLRLLEAIAENSDDAIFAKDREGRYLLFNPAASRFVGRPAEAVLGCDDRAIFPPEQAEILIADGRRVMSQERTETIEEDLDTTDGKKTFLTTKGPLRDDEGRVFGMFGVARDITDVKHAVTALRESETKYRLLAENAADFIFWTEPDGGFRYVSPACEAVTGYRAEAFMDDPELMPAITHPDDREAYRRHVSEGAQNDRCNMDLRIRHADGGVRWISHYCRPLYDAQGRYLGRNGANRDITGRKLAEERQRQAAAVYESSRDGIVITDPEANIVAVNPAVCAITGYDENELIGQNPRLFQSGRHDRAFFQRMWAAIQRQGGWSGEIWNRRKDGSVYPEWLSISEVRNEEDELVNYTGVFSDLTQLRRSEAQLEYLTYHDPLTDLPNRALLDARLEHAIEQARRRGYSLGVLLLDLDRFKDINDSLGMGAGDQLLQEVAQRIRGCVRHEDTVARLSGDELVVVLEAVGEPNHAAETGRKILDALRAPYHVDEHELFLTASIGISLFPDNGDTPERLLRSADAAVYRAKDEGRNRIQFYSDSLSRSALQRLSMEAGLRRALQHGELELHYQPQIYLESGALAGVEALVRWRHPERGLVPPAEFIPVAESSGLIDEIGAWVLEAACRQMAGWRAAGLQIPRMAVNLSARQLGNMELLETVSATLGRHALPPEALELELTETAIMREPGAAAEILVALASQGITLAVDDFGTGYSSLAYLQRLRLHRLKIDRTFVQGLPESPNNAAICRAIIAMAASLGMETVAEGVEEEAQRRFLSDATCGIGQGWLFARPLPEGELEAWLKQHPSP